ncbi:MAG: PQQ-dependent sugar dehydrogenase, partial [Sphingomonadales bacterium]|nr:PQQ-dependent sugar dehydrogenase [Sphingomonadales bacterium]
TIQPSGCPPWPPDQALTSPRVGAPTPRRGALSNLIEAGRNYGWPEVSNGSQYSGIPIPDHSTRPDFAAPRLWWGPVIAPAGLSFVPPQSDFPDWTGDMLIGALAGQGLVRVAGDGSDQIARWDLNLRVRDVAVDAAGAIWIIEDSDAGGLFRLLPR